MKVKMVDDASNWTKWWSVRLSIIGGAILTFLELYPNAIGTVVQALPSEVRAGIDPEIFRVIGIVCVLASPIARVVKQSKLDDKG
jgi:xanthine/uracil permease